MIHTSPDLNQPHGDPLNLEDVELESQAWNDSVVEVIARGQRVGYQWSLSGDILTERDGWSNESSVSGVRLIEWVLDRRWTMPGIVDA